MPFVGQPYQKNNSSSFIIIIIIVITDIPTDGGVSKHYWRGETQNIKVGITIFIYFIFTVKAMQL